MIESAFMEDAQVCRGYVYTCTAFLRTREYLQKRQKSQTYLPGAQGTTTQTGLENHMNTLCGQVHSDAMAREHLQKCQQCLRYLPERRNRVWQTTH